MATKITAENISPTEEKILIDVASDLAALRASIVALTAKLDLDATVTDTDYAATCNPAALNTTA